MLEGLHQTRTGMQGIDSIVAVYSDPSLPQELTILRADKLFAYGVLYG